MKQVNQLLSSGKIYVEEMPIPIAKEGHLIIQTSTSIISSGTERMLLEFGKSNLIGKAMQQPDKVSEVFEKVKTNGLLETFDSVNQKLDQPIALGYSSVGIIKQIGTGVNGFKVGDRVVSNGPHSEFACVPQNLAAIVPETVDDETACFTILGAIGLQGIRLAKPAFGETFVVMGLGLIGLLTAQILKANGCNVIGLDPDPEKCKLANSFEIETCNNKDNENILNWFDNYTSNKGIDGVIVTASTSSTNPIKLACQISRKKGRIILIGVTGLDLSRDWFYKKELKFQVSCSYGPGRYDPSYELEGNDYPYAYVRWTEKRNFEAILKAFHKKQISTRNLVSHKFDIDNAEKAYEILLSKKSSAGIIINYGLRENRNDNSILINNKPQDKPPNHEIKSSPNISFIGIGNYASRVLLPSFKKLNINFHSIASNQGLNSSFYGKKYGFYKVTNSIDEILNDKEVDAVVISTRHDSHAKLITQSLKKGKHIFIEKPLCLTLKELEEIKSAYTSSSITINGIKRKPILTVGFNRRFSPYVDLLKSNISKLNNPSAYIYNCNAGYIPNDHWIQNPLIGGGRLIGECCHFLDLLRYLNDSQIVKINIMSMKDEKINPDTFSLQILFKNGSIGTINYFANGSKKYPKERLEVFNSGKIFVLDNFRKLYCIGSNKFNTMRSFRQLKGQKQCAESFYEAIKYNQESPIPLDQLFEVQESILNL